LDGCATRLFNGTEGTTEIVEESRAAVPNFAISRGWDSSAADYLIKGMNGTQTVFLVERGRLC
jgi:hypothetical protein